MGKKYPPFQPPFFANSCARIGTWPSGNEFKPPCHLTCRKLAETDPSDNSPLFLKKLDMNNC